MDVPQTGQGRGNGNDDGAITPQQLVAELMTAIHSIGSQTKFARRKGVSQSLVSLTVTGKRGIDESIANALGYVKRVRVEYVPIQRSTRPPAPVPGDDLTTGDKLSSAVEPEFEGGAARHHGDTPPSEAADVARIGA